MRICLLTAIARIGISAEPVRIDDALPALPVSEFNLNVFSTPIAYRDGTLVTVNVEPPALPDTGMNLRTVVRMGYRENEKWNWVSYVLASNTLADRYHAAGSVAFDDTGYVHVAGNMHNMPWQYWVSREPMAIADGFEFRGDSMTESDFHTVFELNKTPFPSTGTADIPGNQITYPAFYTDREGALYVTYRYAVRPKRGFSEREFGGGIARYDSSSTTWAPIGGAVSVSNEDADLPVGTDAFDNYPFAVEPGWAVYLPRLWFDTENEMHVAWLWREGGAGPDTSHPSYARSVDGGISFHAANGLEQELPVSVSASNGPRPGTPERNYYAPLALTADAHGAPIVLLRVYEGAREIVRFDASRGEWSEPVAAPFGATSILADDNGSMWAFASGIRVLRSNDEWPPSWQLIQDDQGFCYPKAISVPGERLILVHSQSCDLEQVKIRQIAY